MSRQSPTTELPILHRLTIVYLMLPMAIWLVGWFRWWLGIPATALLVAGLWRTLGGSWRVSPRPATFVSLLMALGWVMTSAAGGIFDVNNADWVKHRATLTDLAQYPWPVHLPDPLAAFLSPEARTRPDALLRYYLGFYMTPGLAGRWFGPAALNWAVPLWTWAGVTLLVLLFTHRFRRTRATVVAAVVLMFFSGMDFLRIVLLSGDVVPLFDSAHIESDEFLLYRILYSSNMAAFMWAPQHFLTSGLYTMLLLQLRGQPRFLASSGILLATCLFWSPFVAVGLLPFVAVLFLDNGPRPFLRWQNLFLAGPLAGLLAAYLTSDTGEIARGWLWHKSDWGELVRWLPVFYLTEFVVLSLLLWRFHPPMRGERFFIASVVTLLMLPVYTYGYFNDLGMRASLPALMILCWYGAEVVSNPMIGRIGRQRGSRPKRRKRPAARRAAKKKPVSTLDPETRRNRTRLALVCMLVTVLVVGAVTPLHELTRAYENFEVFRYQRMLFSMATSTPRPAWTSHIADDVPAVLRGVLKAREDTGSVDGRWESVIRSTFDVYRNRKLLLYTKTPCTEEDLEPVFFVDVWPKHVRDLPEHRQRHGFDRFLYADLRIYALWMGARCAALRRLPEYDIERVATGQLEHGRRVWRGEFSLAPP